MKNLSQVNNTWGDDKVIDACSIFGMMDRSGRCFSGKDIIRAIGNMHDRGNGLGGGFAVYGIYPDHKEFYAFHIMFNDRQARTDTETYLSEYFNVHSSADLPVRESPLFVNPPVVRRYFVQPRVLLEGLGEDDTVVRRVMDINTIIDGAFVFSSGKNMGVFKGVGFPEDIGRYFRLEDVGGYLWTAHGRFPTNTAAWWGGAHPFSILDWTVVHNGEISSYGTNRRFLEMHGYFCTMHTDTEVLAYAVDLLVRRHGLDVETMAGVLAPPLWEQIERMSAEDKRLHTVLRQVYAPLLMNGPFTIITAHEGEMIGLTDRVRLRPLTAGEKGDMLYLSSEEASIRLICPGLERAWIPMGGEPVVGRLKNTKSRRESVRAAS